MPSVGLLLAYGVATFLAFPHPVGEGVLDLGAGLAWLSPAFLILGLAGCEPKVAARRGLMPRKALPYLAAQGACSTLLRCEAPSKPALLLAAADD